MAYEKQTWACGDTITADKMNHMEEGIENAGSSVLEVGMTTSGNTITLDKTWQEIYDAMPNAYISLEANGKICILGTAVPQNHYIVITFDPTQEDMQMMVFFTDSASGYPVLRTND